MGAKEFVKFCKEEIVKYHNETSDERKITKADVYMVWYCKTLQNHKALLSTKVADDMYYEMTLNGDKNEVYLDAYKKNRKTKELYYRREKQC